MSGVSRQRVLRTEPPWLRWSLIGQLVRGHRSSQSSSGNHVEADSALTFARSELPECFPIPFEIGSRKVINFVLLQKAVHLHSCFETKQPPKLSG